MSGDRERADAPEAMTPVELLLGHGTSAERDAVRRRVAGDPSLALELAETVALFERLRQVRTEPGPKFAGKLADVVRRAELRLGPRASGPGAWLRPWLVVQAAAATFVALWAWDPLGRFAPRGGNPDPFATPATAQPNVVASAPEPEPDGVEPRDSAALAWEAAVDQVRRRLQLEASPRLRDAWETGLRSDRDPLSDWLDPRNALVLSHLDHELRASTERRTAALQRYGGLPAVDRRVQQLADGIAADDLTTPAAMQAADVPAVALAVRALIAAGPGSAARGAAVLRGGDWLAAQLPGLYSDRLVAALGALADLAAVDGRYFELVGVHGRRLLDGVLHPDQDNWDRHLPDLLGDRISAATLGDAGRLLSRLPAFGAEPQRCTLVRQLLLGELRKRSDAGQDRPELLAAMLYGGGDLLDDDERGRIERDLRRWKLARLAPDYATVQQVAWGIQPGRRGFAHLQGELRQLAILPLPPTAAERAAFCLCLATNYASCPGALLAAERGAANGGV